MKLLNVPEGHKKSETFFRVSEKLQKELSKKGLQDSKNLEKGLQKSKTFEKGLEKDICLKKIILLSLSLVFIMLLASSCKPEKLVAGNKPIPGFYNVIMISIPEDYNDINNLKEIHIANVTVDNNGKLSIVATKDDPAIEKLKTAIKNIESEEGLFLEYEDKEGDKLVLKKELVKPGDPRYIYALEGELALAYGFIAEMR